MVWRNRGPVWGPGKQGNRSYWRRSRQKSASWQDFMIYLTNTPSCFSA